MIHSTAHPPRLPADYTGTACANGHAQGPGLCVVTPWYCPQRRKVYWRRVCLECRRRWHMGRTVAFGHVPTPRPAKGHPVKNSRLIVLAAGLMREPWGGVELSEVCLRFWPRRFNRPGRLPRDCVRSCLLGPKGAFRKGWIEKAVHRQGRPGNRYRLTPAGQVELERLRGLLGGRPVREADRVMDVVRRRPADVVLAK